MVKKYLIDTCVWRDFYENRFSKNKKPLGKYATKLFTKIINNNSQILFSKSLILELKNDYDEKEINDMLNLLFFNKILKKIEITKEEYSEAKRLVKERNIPFIDCLNAVQARNHKAIMVTQDKHFFQKLNDIVKAKRPQEII
ncbi:PIN domain-containing protein [Candidatus Woesearchaeota archaeon]|nr:PIN domain-containing protein [Candidatus Woesearchaeota archaeon]